MKPVQRIEQAQLDDQLQLQVRATPMRRLYEAIDPNDDHSWRHVFPSPLIPRKEANLSTLTRLIEAVGVGNLSRWRHPQWE